jgi:uncharacterized protein YjbJ (UPF0337 family)
LQGINAEEAATMAINVQGLQGQWNQLKGELRKRWGQLSDDDLKWSGGNIDQLVGRIQQRTGETREAIEKYLDHLTSHGASAVSGAVESVGSYAQEMSHRLRDHYGDLSEQAREGYLSARDAISRNPLPWIRLAFGIGVLTGALVSINMAHAASHQRRFFG